MVKKLLKFLGYTLFFVFALVLFMPKESFYYLLEKELKSFDLVISGETLHERLFSLELENLSITAKGVDAAEIGSTDVVLFGFYNRVLFENIELSSLVSSYAPPHIEELRVSYTLLNPLEIKAFAQGDFGEAKVALNLIDRELNAVVEPSKLMQTKYKNTMNMLKKDENGEYTYAKAL